MLTSPASALCFETQRRAQRGTSAFVACGQHRTTSSARTGNQQPLFSALHLSRHAARASFARLRGSCRLGAFFYIAMAKLIGFLVHQHIFHGGTPTPNGARPNPSLKRSANGSPPGPVCRAGALASARAWRATVVSRLAHTLGLASPPSQARHRSLKFRGAHRTGRVLSQRSASNSGSYLAVRTRVSHWRGQL